MGVEAADVGAAGVEPGQALALQTATKAIQSNRELPKRATVNGLAKLTSNLTVTRLTSAYEVDRKPTSGGRARMAYAVVA